MLNRYYEIEVCIGDLFECLFTGAQDEILQPINGMYMQSCNSEWVPILSFIRKEDDIVSISTLNNSMKCGSNHRILGEQGWEFVRDIEKIVNEDEYLEIVLHREHLGIGKVYDVSLPAPHIYRTPNGWLHHNTTIAKAMCNELDCDVLTINASLNGNVDTLRNEISQFASTMSFKSGRKIVFLDEADNLTQATQAGLRAFMEEFASNCGFILTCNFKNRIIEPLHSRLSVIDFSIPKEEQPKLAMEFFKRMEEILTAEGVGYDKDAVVALIKQHFPDWRRVIGELQRYSATGHINTGVLATVKDKDFDELVGLLKNKKWNEMRKWVGEHTDVEPNALLRHFYDQSKTVIKPASIPTLVLLLAETQYRLQFSADHEICIAAFLTQTMSEISFQ